MRRYIRRSEGTIEYRNKVHEVMVATRLVQKYFNTYTSMRKRLEVTNQE